MTSKDLIFSKIKGHTHHQYGKPQMNLMPMSFNDKMKSFIEISQAVGGAAIVLEKDKDINELIKELYPEAKTIASNIPLITCRTMNPDELEDATALNGTDLGVVQGIFGVVENGAVWIRQSVKHKAIYFISEALVILLDKTHLVNTMHEAYAQPDFNDYDFGCFIAGPSKTADIEQALVIGAHGAKKVTVILT